MLMFSHSMQLLSKAVLPYSSSATIKTKSLDEPNFVVFWITGPVGIIDPPFKKSNGNSWNQKKQKIQGKICFQETHSKVCASHKKHKI